MNFKKKLLNLLHPVLKPLSSWYLSKPRKYSYNGIHIRVHPGVFHPGLFFSTKIFINFLGRFSLKDMKLLELGCGSGLISIFAAKHGAITTGSDISRDALETLRTNAAANNVDVRAVYSDLFESISPEQFDMILINPPFYPKDPIKEKDFAWYCGENFEYFKKLFSQIKGKLKNTKVFMILSEDCDIDAIQKLASLERIAFALVYEQQKYGEKNFIYQLMEK